MSNNKDFKIKNGIKPTVYQETLGTVVSGSVGYYLAGASYDSKSFSVASQETTPRGVAFNINGTKMYVIGETNNTVFQYSLSTAFDVSTASYDSVSYTVSSQITTSTSVTFNNDGTKMYVIGYSSTSVYQYSLSTAFDLSTTSYDSISFNVTSQVTVPLDVIFNNDGTKMYVIGNTQVLYQYSLSTAFNVSTASYDSVNLVVTTQSTDPQAVVFNSNGTKLYVLDRDTDTVYEYPLSTAFNVSTASYNSVSFSILSQDNSPHGLAFNNDGTKMFMIGKTSDAVYQYSTVLNTAQLDLSTGSVFDYTPTSNAQVKLTNPAASGTASGATLLLGSEDAAGVSSTFSTTLYTGTGAAKTISNGLNLSTDGGLVWIKRRDASGSHALWDSGRGISNWLSSDNTSAQVDYTTTAMVSFNTDGFTLGVDTVVNRSAASWVSWAFKKKTKFFDIVTYTGTAAVQNIAHNLGSVPGMIIVKRLDSASFNWQIYHKNSNATPEDYRLEFTTGAAQLNTGVWGSTAPTDTHFTVGANGDSNGSGAPLVAYLFAHDTDASSLIKCGSYTGNGSTNGPEIDLGWEPQWLMIKRSDSADGWPMVDSMRGFAADGSVEQFSANNSDAGAARTDRASPTAAGFKLRATDNEWNASGGTYIYMAIRNSSIPTITYDPTLQWSGGTAPTAPAMGETDLITFNTTDGGTTYKSALAIDGAK